ncbi:MAG: hypothetical protein H7833_14695 [Magnetococcus sp. DMHC-1]
MRSEAKECWFNCFNYCVDNIPMMAYEWDMGKASMNFAKHGVLFTDAVDFEWDRAMGWVDARRD